MARPWTFLGAAGLACAVAVTIPPGRERFKVSFAPARTSTDLLDSTIALRDDALRRAKVWQPTDPETFDLANNPPDPTGTLSGPVVRCRFVPHQAEGTTPKFRCALPDGEIVKVKYGRHTGEVHAELAASRLLTALGFGADSMYLVERLRCYGCPPFPFETMWVLERVGVREAIASQLPDDRYSDFHWVAVERRFPGTEVTAGDQEGWAWHELDRVDASVGASRAELDALQLMAVFLAHWDNKAQNQRLVCVPGAGRSEDRLLPGQCAQPFAIMQDLGATFGPNKVSLDHWRESPIWSDPARCLVSMKTLPYDGATFVDREIGEAGRALLARQLHALSEEQIRALFNGARFAEAGWGFERRADLSEWVDAFRDKVRQIVEAGPCPAQPKNERGVSKSFSTPAFRG